MITAISDVQIFLQSKMFFLSEIAVIIAQFHAITGADCVSGFFGHVYKSMISNKTDMLILNKKTAI
jgi:hypothetical protein